MRARHCTFVFSFVAAWLINAPVLAACWSGKAQTVKLQSLTDAGTFVLGDGRELVLAGLERPVGPAAIAGWRETSADILSQPVTFYSEGPLAEDRYGRVQALVVAGDQVLLQTRIVEAGWARVHPTRDRRMCTSRLLEVEVQARASRLGIWSYPTFQSLDAADTKTLLALDGTYQIVFGQVLDVARKKGRLYLNFGRDWKTDFTVTVAPSDARLFDSLMFAGDKSGTADIIGRRVRVRGFLSRYNGPSMDVATPGQIEFLSNQVRR